MSDYTNIQQLAREAECVVVIFDVEDVEAVIRLSGLGMEEWTREKMLRFLQAQGDSLSELVADKGLEILERELKEWSDTITCGRGRCKKPGCDGDHDDYNDGGPPPEEIAGWASALNAHQKERFGDWP